jgi:hypothetical protein
MSQTIALSTRSFIARLSLVTAITVLILAAALAKAAETSNRLAANRLAANRLAANRLAANKLAASRLSENRLEANSDAAELLGPRSPYPWWLLGRPHPGWSSACRPLLCSACFGLPPTQPEGPSSP